MSRKNRKNKDKQKGKKKEPGKQKSLWKKILLGIFGLILFVGVAGLGLFAYYASSAPELTEEDLSGSYSADLLDMNGEIFYTLGGDEREFAEASEYPQVLLDAMMAIEDQRFESHLGIDPIGIARAAVGYVTNAGEIVGGGSTITQQLIKLSVFSTEKSDQTLERKAQEAWLAIQLEQELSKEQIMTLYLNRIHMGSNVYGVATAAEEYYGKHVSELELHEAAMFAAMPKAPNYYNPYVDVEAAEARRNLVLNEMVDFEAITQEEADAAKQIPVTEGLLERTEDTNNLVFDSYLSLVLDEIEEKTDYDVYTSGLTIHTNYDPSAQQLLYDVSNTEEYLDFPDDRIQTAMTLIDSRTGKITAIIGGRNYTDQLSFNRATDMRRDVGSTIKPLTAYGPAIEFLDYSTYTQIVDEPYDLWDLNNYDMEFDGQMSIREALVDSRNVPAAKLFNDDEHLGNYHAEIEEFLQSVGINVDNISQDGTLVAQNAINATMSPLELTGAYTAFANEGNYTDPHAVTKIVTQDGEEIDLTPSTNRVLKESTAYMITDMLKGIIPYYGSQLRIPGYIQAAKTGTTNYTAEQRAALNIPSNGVPDNWVVGYSPYYTMSVWVGYDQPLEEGNYLTSTDGSLNLPRLLYREAMTRLVEGFEQRDWDRPESVVQVAIEDGTDPAKLARPGSDKSVTELFIRGTQPTEVAEPEYVLTAPTGLRARYVTADNEVQINWNAFELPENVDEEVEYVITVNGQETTKTETEHLISDPPRELLTISVAVRVDGETGPASEVTIIVPEQQEEEEEEPEENEESENPDETTDPETTEPEQPDDPTEPDDPGAGNTPPENGEETPPEETNTGNNGN